MGSKDFWNIPSICQRCLPHCTEDPVFALNEPNSVIAFIPLKRRMGGQNTLFDFQYLESANMPEIVQKCVLNLFTTLWLSHLNVFCLEAKFL